MRICDVGGWTDTWFARYGRVFNIAVGPRTEVRVDAFPVGARPQRVTVDARNYGDRYGFEPEAPPRRHPLLEATVAVMGLPHGVAVEIAVSSAVPAGSSMGTSASTAVALVGALDALTPGRMSAPAIAAQAHRIEVETLGIESGVQDQLCAVHGGVNFIEIVSYPEAVVHRLRVPPRLRAELERRLVVVDLGEAHVSSHAHTRVIESLARRGDDGGALEALRAAADRARDAVCAGDLAALGEAMRMGTVAQAELSEELVGAPARSVIEIAAAHGALGWKVNGAGGDGGSVTVLCGGDAPAPGAMVDELCAANGAFRQVPVRLSDTGLQVRTAAAPPAR